MDAEKVALGGLLVALSCYVLIESGFTTTGVPLSTVALGAVGLSIGSLLSGAVRT